MTKVTIDTSAYRKWKQKAHLHVHREVKKQVGKSLRLFLRDHAKANLSGGKGLGRRTGALVRSFKSVVRGRSLETIRGTAFSEGVVYAAIHEKGGTIRPKRRRWLTIPLKAAKTPAGVPRYTAAEVISNPALGGFVSAFFKKSKKGNLILFGSKRGGNITPLFVLKKKVKIKARLKFIKTWRKRTPKTRAEIRDAVARGLRAARR